MKLTRTKPEPAAVRCEGCGWTGVPGARRARTLVGPVYVGLALAAILADAAGALALKSLLTPAVAATVLLGLPGLLVVLSRLERCPECGSRGLQPQSGPPSRADEP